MFVLVGVRHIRHTPNYDYAGLPTCNNCIYYRDLSPESKVADPEKARLGGKCKLFGKVNIITGEILLDNAKQCRDMQDRCGFMGKYYTTVK